MTQPSVTSVDRRSFLRLAGALGAAGAFAGTLAACSDGPPSTGSSDGGTKTIEAGISYALSTGFDPMSDAGGRVAPGPEETPPVGPRRKFRCWRENVVIIRRLCARSEFRSTERERSTKPTAQLSRCRQ